MRAAAARVVSSQPETLVLISPHSPRRPGAFGIWAGERLQGTFAQFNAPGVQVSLPNDAPFARQIVADAVRNGGYPPLYVDPIDFHRLYLQRLQAANPSTANA